MLNQSDHLEVAERKKLALLAMPYGFLTLVLALAFLPIVSLMWISAAATPDVWTHLLNYVLPVSARDTVLLLVLVAFGTGLIGASTAWITTLFDFPGRRIFVWLLVLPLAVPTYIAAYSHVEFFDFSGPLQTNLRHWLGYTSSRDYWFPDIRSLWGAGLIFSVVLYPYVFLTCRLVFSSQGASALDASRSLGAAPGRVFTTIGIPMARPALAAGIALVLMETLNDIGAVEILGVKTLTYAVFETWLNRDSLAGATQLALLTLGIVAFLIWIERRARQNKDYALSTRDHPPARMHLPRNKQYLCIAWCLTPVILGLGVPLWILGTYAIRRFDEFVSPELLQAAANSLLLSVVVAALATALSYCVLQFARVAKKRSISTVGKISSLGYAIPGTVLAIGLLIPIAAFDNWFDGIMRHWFGISTGLLISGSMALLVYACTLRFMAIAYGTIETGFQKVSGNVDMAARALGRNKRQLAWQIHRPILTKSLAVAFLFVFVDTMKELSATLLLRPFKFETLATFIYDRASQAALEEAAGGSLLIMVIGLASVLFLTKLTNQT